MKKLIIALLLFIVLSSANLIAQHKLDSAEITSSVPELFEFHDVIYVIWHEAYPAKDISALKSMVDKIKPYMEKINAASLPGILQDKKAKWDEGLKVLNASAENYYSAAAGTDDQKMLDAAEKLHADFEMMVRVIRPVAKEVDDYHKILYVIYHKYYPAKDYKAIAGVIDDLIAKAEACVDAKLSKRLESKTDQFKTEAQKLVEKTKDLKTALQSNDPKTIDKAVDVMHSQYQDVEKVFE
jgi:hypothetical protein